MINYEYRGKTLPFSIEAVAKYLTENRIPRENIVSLKHYEYRSSNGIKANDYCLLYTIDKDNPGK